VLPSSYFFLFLRLCDLLDLHSFPTRRSSDLRDLWGNVGLTAPIILIFYLELFVSYVADEHSSSTAVAITNLVVAIAAILIIAYRSEEHTSELQSRFDLVCRLLLEKKK